MSEQTRGKKSFFDGNFGRFILPAIILQSTLIGGGYATGREIVAYGAKFGSLGWIAGISIFFGFGLMAFLMFEVARIFRAYDYKSMVKNLIGPFWFLFDIIYLLLAVLIISIMAAATGSIVESTLGINYWVGVVGIAIIVGVLNLYGERLIERFETYGTLALMAGYIIFGIMVISSTWDDAMKVFASGDTSYVSDFSIWTIIWSGIIYVGYNLAVYPAALFTVKRQKSIKDTIISGLVAGVLMTLPWFLTYFALMGFYPSESVFGAEIPWLQMLNGYGTWVVVLFGIVVGWTLVETATGMIHAFLERLDNNLEELGKKKLTKKQSGLVAFITLAASVLLAEVGIMDLVSKGYTALGYGMLIVFGLPLITVGPYRIYKHFKEKKNKVDTVA